MKEYDDFIFVASSAAFYEWVENRDPGHVRRNSAARQRRPLAGRRRLVDRAGLQHPWRRSRSSGRGCTVSATSKPSSAYGARRLQRRQLRSCRDAAANSQQERHSLLQLPAPHAPREKSAGAPVLVGSRRRFARVDLPHPFEYCTWGKEVDAHVTRCAAEIRAPFDEGMCFYGVGNHGGGPTKANIESIHRLNADPNLPEIVMSSPEAFFDSMAAPAKICRSRSSTTNCSATPPAATLPIPASSNGTAALRIGSSPPKNGHCSRPGSTTNLIPTDFEQAWKSVLFSQFHDILAGTSLEIAYDDARNSFGEALAIADRALNYAVQSFAWNVNIEPEDDMRPIIVFNPHTWTVRANVELEANRWKPEAVLVDDRDQPVPFQQMQSTTVTGRVRLSFSVDLPALGYRVYRLRPTGMAGEFPSVEASSTVLESASFRLIIDPETGYVSHLFDKRTQVEVFSQAAAVPLVIEDTSDTWGHDTFRYDKVIGTFKATSVQLAEHGPVKSVIRVMSAYGKSTLIQDFTMYPDCDQIDVNVIVDWHEQFKLLKLSFPVNVYFMRITNEIAYGHIQQAAFGDEAPCQSWIDLSGMARGGSQRLRLQSAQ